MLRHGLGLGLGGLGRDKGFLCRDRVLLALCRDRMWSRPRGFVSRPKNCVATGYRDGRIPVCRHMSSVVTENSLSRQRSFGLVSRQRFYVATGPGAGEVKACGDRAPWMRDRVRNRAHVARDKPTTMHCVMHCLESLFMCTIKKNDP